MKAKPIITVTPNTFLFTDAIDIQITNLPANVHVSLRALLKDEDDRPWFSSEAIFKTDHNGAVNPHTQAPVFGSYDHIDPMGLFWSMLPVSPLPTTSAVKGNELDVFLSLSLNDAIVAETTIHRFIESPDIETKKITEHGFTGVMCYPKNATHLPGIITLSGSGGGLSIDMARLLAAQGYAVLALAYFDMDDLPDHLVNIPLEYFQQAIHWFKNQSQVNANKVALRGASYGGELVLLLAATFPEEFQAVIALSPPSMIFGGFPYSNKPAWTYKDAPILPFIGGLRDDDTHLTEMDDLLYATKQGIIPFHKGSIKDPHEITPLFLARLKKYDAILERAAIPVERIQCPLLLMTGDADTVHPATLHGQLIMERLAKHNSTIERTHLNFPNAGHAQKTPYEPTVDQLWCLNNMWCSSGGTAQGNAHAAKETWRETLAFLQKSLQ